MEERGLEQHEFYDYNTAKREDDTSTQTVLHRIHITCS